MRSWLKLLGEPLAPLLPTNERDAERIVNYRVGILKAIYEARCHALENSVNTEFAVHLTRGMAEQLVKELEEKHRLDAIPIIEGAVLFGDTTVHVVKDDYDDFSTEVDE